MSDCQANYLQVVRNCKRSFTTILMFWINFLKRVRCRIQTFTKCKIPNRKFDNLSELEWKTYKVSEFESELHIVSIFKSNSFQRGRYRNQKSSIRQISNRKFHNVAAAESKLLCARFLIKKSTSCQIWNQTVTKNYVIY